MPSSGQGGDWREGRSSSGEEASCGQRRRPINRAGYWVRHLHSIRLSSGGGEGLSTVGFLANASVSGVARGDSPLLGCGVSPQNLFSRFCSPPAAARRKKEEHWGHPKPRQEASPPAPPKNLLLREGSGGGGASSMRGGRGGEGR